MATLEKLDTLARSHAVRHGVSFAKAYDIVLQTPEGRELYAKSESEPRPVVKAAPTVERQKSAGERKLEELARDRAEKLKISFATAYGQVLDTAEGKRLYEVDLAEAAAA